MRDHGSKQEKVNLEDKTGNLTTSIKVSVLGT